MRSITGVLITLAAVGLPACSRTPPPPAPPPAPAPSRFELTVPGRSSSAPAAAALGSTAVIVWTASTDAESDLFASVSQDRGASFAPPVRVNDVAGDVRASGEQAAQVALAPGGLVHVAWPSRRDGRTVIRYALSRDGGRTFSKAITAAGSGQSGARGWHALTLGYDRAAHLIWLDGRNAAPAGAGRHAHGSHAQARPAAAPRQDVFHRALGKPQPGVVGGEERLLAAQVCFCCKTAIATSGARVYAAWRHIFPGSIRDIAVARSNDNGVTFAEPVRLSDDGWEIAACPDDGPTMVADGHGGIHLAWPTLVPGETPRKGIFYSRIGDGDRFTPRLRLDAGDGDPAHPRITSDEHTDVAVVWDERAGGGRRVVLRRIVEGVAAPPEIFPSDGANYPAIAGPSGSWVVVWSAPGPDGLTRIEGRRLPIASTP